MTDLSEHCVGFERGLHLVNRDVVSKEVADGMKDCYQVLVPVIDTNKYLLWLHLLALELGVGIFQVNILTLIYQDVLQFDLKAITEVCRL